MFQLAHDKTSFYLHNFAIIIVLSLRCLYWLQYSEYGHGTAPRWQSCGMWHNRWVHEWGAEPALLQRGKLNICYIWLLVLRESDFSGSQWQLRCTTWSKVKFHIDVICKIVATTVFSIQGIVVYVALLHVTVPRYNVLASKYSDLKVTVYWGHDKEPSKLLFVP